MFPNFDIAVQEKPHAMRSIIGFFLSKGTDSCTLYIRENIWGIILYQTNILYRVYDLVKIMQSRHNPMESE